MLKCALGSGSRHGPMEGYVNTLKKLCVQQNAGDLWINWGIYANNKNKEC